ncbi:dTDP-4-dehydrorhamnose 3,5-epimerase [Desulfotignum balticum]|uniref:dTDP-4-dehydrorhamnose 3,5-epimerase n=1 Tax=Desulfotignum balticum TaxID=115781 RepID=UPI00042A674B|nr:dTDP-4-dehydrorhamnose 3,5-epimerase [Desulfotignum balticum]
MNIKPRKLTGTFEISLNPLTDDRGFFMRTFDDTIFQEHGMTTAWVQENHSRSEKKWIIRGLHFQCPPYAETKLVRCIRGAVLDVFVDLRLGSATFGRWDSIELSEENKKAIYIPRGFAHGFCTLTDISEILYKVDNYYSKESEAGIAWNDKEIGIDWRATKPVLSEKDQNNLSFETFIDRYKGISV